jgi:protein-tyrosine phosphatase
MALTVIRKLVVEHGLSYALQVESAGTYPPSPAQAPDPRAIDALVRRGYQPRKSRSMRITAGHFVDFDVVLAMDNANLAALNRMCPPEYAHKLGLFLSYAPGSGRMEIPDPYYGGVAGFEVVLDLCEAAAYGLVSRYTRS